MEQNKDQSGAITLERAGFKLASHVVTPGGPIMASVTDIYKKDGVQLVHSYAMGGESWSIGAAVRGEALAHPAFDRDILYTDVIQGEQVRRDDLWAITTTELKALLSARAADAPSEPSEFIYQFRARVLPGRVSLEWSGWEYCQKDAYDEMSSMPNFQVRVFGLIKSRAADALYSQPTMPTPASNGWFSVDDRLPNVGTKALTAGYIRNIPGNNFWQDTAMYTRDGWFYEYQQEHHYKPTHWMPLPPGPASSQPTDGGVRNG